MEGEKIREGFTRVTSVISKFSGIDQIPKDILEVAASRGSLTHKYIELYLKGEEIHVVPPVVQPYLDSFKRFWDASSHAWDLHTMELEKRFYCDDYRITGQIDCIIRGGGKTYLMDWKTSAKFYKSFRLQGACYKYLADINGYSATDDLMFVSLSKEGKKPTLHKPDTFLEDVEMFFNCLSVYRWHEMEKRK